MRAGAPGRDRSRRLECPIEALADSRRSSRIEVAGVDIVAYRVVRIRRLPDARRRRVRRGARARDRGRREELAPLHTRGVLAAREALRRAAPAPGTSPYSTAAFHRSIPDRAAAYGLPYDDFVAGLAQGRLPRTEPRVRRRTGRGASRRSARRCRKLVSAISAAAARWPRSRARAASTRRWASHRSTAC